MKKTGFIAITWLCLAFGANAQDSFTPNGKPIIRVFSNAHSTFSDGTNTSAFEVTRVYLGYEHYFSSELTGTVIYDVANPGVGGLQMTAYLKNAFLNYKHKNLSVNFGMMPTLQFKAQEDFWGNRYIEKVFQDAYGMTASADLGASATYKFCDFFSADFSITNGEGYKKIQSDTKYKSALGLTLNPTKELTIRGMADVMGQGTTQNTFAGFVSYKASKFSIGGEYNYQKNHGFKADNNYFGTSFYGSVDLAKKVKFFARYDNLKSNMPTGVTADWNLASDGQLFMAGLEYAPVSRIKLSPNFRGWSPADSSKPYTSTLMLNCDIKF